MSNFKMKDIPDHSSLSTNAIRSELSPYVSGKEGPTEVNAHRSNLLESTGMEKQVSLYGELSGHILIFKSFISLEDFVSSTLLGNGRSVPAEETFICGAEEVKS